MKWGKNKKTAKTHIYCSNLLNCLNFLFELFGSLIHCTLCVPCVCCTIAIDINFFFVCVWKAFNAFTNRAETKKIHTICFILLKLWFFMLGEKKESTWKSTSRNNGADRIAVAATVSLFECAMCVSKAFFLVADTWLNRHVGWPPAEDWTRRPTCWITSVKSMANQLTSLKNYCEPPCRPKRRRKFMACCHCSVDFDWRKIQWFWLFVGELLNFYWSVCWSPC